LVFLKEEEEEVEMSSLVWFTVVNEAEGTDKFSFVAIASQV
jgi:hypothetical protein